MGCQVFFGALAVRAAEPAPARWSMLSMVASDCSFVRRSGAGATGDGRDEGRRASLPWQPVPSTPDHRRVPEMSFARAAQLLVVEIPEISLLSMR
jgi:hypothetical protein